ncbi:MAG: sugar phosphate isomerase/epimerase family protein [Planctomycetota bacterium]|jgi:sugar phosphate isomerase/epimerase
MAKKVSKKKAAPMRLGVQLYTLREYMQTPKQMATTLKKVAKMGYTQVQISGIGPVDALDFKKMLDDAGLVATGHHCGMADLRSDLIGLIDKLHAWNVDYTAVAYLAPEDRKNAAGYRARGKEMAKFGAELRKEGVALQYHNHAFELHRYKDKTGLDLIYENSDRKTLQAEIDTYWISAGGADPIQWIESMKGRMDQIHFKDGVMLNDQFTICEVGQGNLNWKGIIAASKAIGVKTAFVEQDVCPVTKNPFKSLKMSYDFLRSKGLK